MSYYAVAKGRDGAKIYRTWAECEAKVKGFSGSIYKKFSTEQDARLFIEENGVMIRGQVVRDKQQPTTSPTIKTKTVDDEPVTDDRIIKIFIDGSCLNNGKANAKAGYACHFPGHSNYDKIEKLVGPRQTNNRAEYSALLLAHKQARQLIVDKKLDIIELEIYTDSDLLYKSVTQWINKWKTNEWHKSDGQPVENRDLLEEIDNLTFPYKLHHVMSHTKGSDYFSIHNNIVDEMAKEGANL
jgi:ribonuclease HI